MSDGYSYIVEMVDKISGPAKTAEQQITSMNDKLKAQAGALEFSRAAMASLDVQGNLDHVTREKAIALITKQEAALGKEATAIRKAVAVQENAAAKLVNEEKKKQEKIKGEQVKAAEAAKKATADSIAMAEKAINIGKETITAAFAGIASSARALAAGDVRGAVDGLVSSVASMAKLLDLVVPGLGQAVAAVISIAGGLVGITAGLIQSGAAFALEAAGAKTAMLSMFDAMGGGLATGAATEEMIDRVKASTGVLKDELVDYTKQLMAMGVTNLDDIENSITAMASATAMMGKEGASAFTSLKAKIEQATAAGVGLKLADKQLAQLYKTGANVDDIAKQMGLSTKDLRNQLNAGSVDAAKFGAALEDALIEKGKGPLDVMTAQLPYLKKMFLESIGDMFEDVDVGGFLKEVKALFAIFSQANPVGQSLKAGIGSFFNSVFDALKEIVPFVKVFFTQLMIYALQAYIACKPLIAAIRDFGGASKDGPGLLTRVMRSVFLVIEEIGKVIKPVIGYVTAFIQSATGAKIIETVLSSLWSVLKSIGIAVLVIVGVFATLWAISAVVAITIWTIIGTLLSLGATISNFVGGIVSALGASLAGTAVAIATWVSNAATAAYDFVAGLVSGITGGAAAVMGAVTGLAGKATGAFKSALGIASPSKVMMDLGVNTTEGLAVGVESGAPDVEGAMANVAAAPVAGAQAGIVASGPAPAPAAASSGASITLAPGSIVITAGGASAAEILELLTSQLSDKLEELMMQLGGAKA